MEATLIHKSKKIWTRLVFLNLTILRCVEFNSQNSGLVREFWELKLLRLRNTELDL